MDVVKAKIESLNGTIDIETEKEKENRLSSTSPYPGYYPSSSGEGREEQYAIPLHSIDETTF